MAETPEPPKLYVNKPKKTTDASGVAAPKLETATQGGTSGAAPYAEPKPLVSPRFWQRFRSAFGVLLVANFIIGGYVLLTKSKSSKDENEEGGQNALVLNKTEVSTDSGHKTSKEQDVIRETGQADVAAISSSVVAPVVAQASHVKESQPQISDDQQREVLKWVLAEKRKIKPANSAEKNKLNEEKKLLKEFIKAKSFPSI